MKDFWVDFSAAMLIRDCENKEEAENLCKKKAFQVGKEKMKKSKIIIINV